MFAFLKNIMCSAKSIMADLNQDIINKVLHRLKVGFEVIGVLLVVSFLVWELEPFSGANFQTLRLEEQFIEGDTVYKQFHLVKFRVDQDTNSAVLLTKQQIAINLNDFYFAADKRALKSQDSRNSTTYRYRHSLKNLNNCVVFDSKNWSCDNSLSFLNSATGRLSRYDNNWLISIDEIKKFHSYQFFKSKLKWMMQKRGCSEICVLGSLHAFEAEYLNQKNEVSKFVRPK
jgi:hypothetical protein